MKINGTERIQDQIHNKKIKQFVPVRGYRLLFQVLKNMNYCAYLHMTSKDGNDVCQERSVSDRSIVCCMENARTDGNL